MPAHDAFRPSPPQPAGDNAPGQAAGPAAPARPPRERARAMEEALARGVLYGALSLSFQRLSGGSLEHLTSAAGHAALGQAAALLGSAELATAVGELTKVRAGVPDLDSAHARLFGHAGGSVCPFETEYGPAGPFRQPPELSDIAGCYRAFGLVPVARIDERADHVASECEFMGFLARKEAFALACEAQGTLPPQEAREMREVAREAGRGFLRDHLGRFGRALATRLTREDGGGFYGALGAVLLHFIGLDCERLGVAAGPATLELRPPSLDEAPMACGEGACGAAPERIQLRRRPRP